MADDFDDRQYWEACRDWLINEKITKHSTKVPGLKDVKEELDLYNYLKDGTELCRLVRVLPEADAVEKRTNLKKNIVYRTNGVSTLEELNVKAFLEITNEVKELKNIFGEHGQKVLQNYENFSSVLVGLSNFSKYVEKTTGVPKFKFKRRKARILRRKIHTQKEKTIQRDRTRDSTNSPENVLVEDSIYENAGQTEQEKKESEKQYNLYVPMNEEPDNLTKAVEEIISVHKNYFKNLRILKEGFVDRAKHFLLERSFKLINVGDLMNCHQRAFTEFDLINIDYSEIANCFERLSTDFLIAYSRYVGIQKKVSNFINDIRSNESEIEDELTDMELGKNLKNRTELFFSKQRVELSSLLMLPTKHIMHYPMMLQNVQKMAKKEKRHTIEAAAKRAAEIMDNVVKFMDKYEKESSYQETMKALQSNINDFTKNLDMSGNLEHECEVQVKMRYEPVFMSSKILCFEQHIIIVDIIKESQYLYTSIFGKPKESIFEIQQYSGKMFPIKKYDIFKVIPSGDHFLLQVEDIDLEDTLQPIKDRSFDLKFEVEEDAKQMQMKLTSLRDKARKGAEPGDFHKDHKFRGFRQKGENTLNDLKKCGFCSAIIPGKFQIGVRCNTCDKIYHINCFKKDTGNVPEKETEVEDHEKSDEIYQCISDIQANVEAEDEFWVDPPELSREEAIERLVSKRKGTFLFRKNQAGQTVISRRMNQEKSKGKKKKDLIVHHILEEKQYDGRHYQWLRKGESFTNLVDFVKYYSKDYALLYPINSDEAIPSGDEDSDEDNEVEGELYAIITVPLKSHMAYLYPDMSASEATQKLRDEPLGTFLIRAKNGIQDHRISYKSTGGVKHFILHKDECGQYYVEADKLYSSIEDLVEHLRGLGIDEKGWLGNPLFNPDAPKPELEDSDNDNLEDPTCLPYFYGTMSGTEAESVLRLADTGSFLLRKNGEGKFRVSFQTNRQMQHIVIHQEDDEYFVSRDNKFETMGKLLKNLIQESQLTTPLVKENGPKRIKSMEVKRSNVGSAPKKASVPQSFDFVPNRPKTIEPTQKSKRSPYIDLNSNKTTKYIDLNSVKVEPKKSSKFLNYGEMDATTATRMLKDKPVKSWFLRSKIPEYRVSLKKEDGNVTHMVVKEEEGKFSCRSLPSRKTASSLDEMITSLIDEEVIQEDMELKSE